MALKLHSNDSKTGQLFAGLMSGTSADGLDAVLARIGSEGIQLVNQSYTPYPEAARAEVLALCSPGENEIVRAGHLGYSLAQFAASAITSLLSNHPKADIEAIGYHGQTIRHHPNQVGPFSLQIGDASVLAQETGIPVVANFRAADIAAGGQGAPLAPAFHAAMFSKASEHRAVVNIGGIANISLLPSEGSVTGFDTGPGNVLMDHWIKHHREKDFDEDGRWAESGEVNTSLLTLFLEDPYFSKAAPKSTGREYFNARWLNHYLEKPPVAPNPTDIQATLCELTAVSVAQEAKRAGCRSVAICGGGAQNLHLMRRLAAHLPDTKVQTTGALGLAPQSVEAAMMAWLAYRHVIGKPGNLPSVTGAQRAVVLGAYHPA